MRYGEEQVLQEEHKHNGTEQSKVEKQRARRREPNYSYIYLISLFSHSIHALFPLIDPVPVEAVTAGCLARQDSDSESSFIKFGHCIVPCFEPVDPSKLNYCEKMIHRSWSLFLLVK